MKQKRAAYKNTSSKSKHSLDEEIQQLKAQYDDIPDKGNGITKFAEFPLSQKTLKGLNEGKYYHPTDIQRESIGPALQGRNVLAAAITGSGKTLAFLIPILEHLYVAKWSRMDGLAAIIISPTRELAYQIFETLNRIGKYHDFSAGLIIGGKNLKFERSRMDQCNILICTPGRLLQHMDENPLFNSTTMEMIVLDEADRCLDMGFESTINAIIENFPPERQTLLFSATQTSSVRDLARLNLHDFVNIGCKDLKNEDKQSTVTTAVVPELLKQSYIVINLEDKITVLWSFLKNHLKQKIIVFLSSCKQVKFIYEIFCKLHPGIGLLALYGTLHQDRRINIYNDFMRRKHVVLFATDIASRGLDFPSVNWVIQLDCPEDVNQYIHRAGRSARNKSSGDSLLVLMPSEEAAMIEQLNSKSITLEQVFLDPKKMFSPRVKMEAYLAKYPELKMTAQRAFVAYIKSVFLMKNKKVFKVKALDFDAFAKSLGLIITPRVRFLERFLKRENNAKANNADESTSDVTQKSTNVHNTKVKTMNDVLFHASDLDSGDEGGDFLKVKRVDHALGDNEDLPAIELERKEKVISKAAAAKKALKKRLRINEVIKFDDEGNEISDPRKHLQSDLAKECEENIDRGGGIDIEISKKLLKEEDKYDKERFRQLIKQRHKKLKEKRKREINGDNDESYTVDDETGTASYSDTDSENLNQNSEHYRSNDDSSNEESVTDDDDDDDEETPPTKRNKLTQSLTLNEAEALATRLLTNTK